MPHDLKVFLYGVFWLMICSPACFFLVVGITVLPSMPSAIEVIGLIATSYFYYEKIWIPVRVLMNRYDNEFIKRMGWYK